MPREQSSLIFVSRNAHKIREAAALCAPYGITIEAYEKKIEELQTDDSERLVQDKMLKAFRGLKRALIVEHTGLLIHAFGNLPGGLTQLFWDKLKADGFAKYFPNHPVKAFTIIGFCDGRRMHQFRGEIDGTIVDRPRGDSDFQWDVVFQPQGSARTFAEMSFEEKNANSMRSRAFRLFLDHVGKTSK